MGALLDKAIMVLRVLIALLELIRALIEKNHKGFMFDC